ncbi:VOC family protein [Blastococcus sp. URHD0036]|uniref:VOC family protein n=1 Tax=Blastococcus sp. URHD0036 TaxID=1380356 RepID=UPI000496F72A|nr:VOC family protein [Blastococcus sp. URHD0036]
MSVTGFSHLSVQVRDIEKVLPFYRDLLGLKVSIDREHSFSAHSGADGERVEYSRREVYLRWEEGPGAAYIVLGQSKREMKGSATPLQEIGFDHVAFEVDDVDAVVARAEELGYECLSGPNTNDGPANAYDGPAAVRTALFYDPERNIVQVDAWLDLPE